MYLAALDPMALVRALPGNVAQGIIWGIMALGVYITFRILDFADLTVDGSLATGGAVAVMLIRGGMNPALALLFAFLAGMVAGFVTGILHTFFGIPGILASILTQIGLYSVNLGIMGKSNQAVNVMQYKLVASLRYVTGEGSELFFVKLIVAALILFFAWPAIFGALVSFGEMIMGAGAIGAGIYGFFNRLLIPFGLHHALNSVYWFDIAGIDDIGKFWGQIEGGVKGVTGMYQAGFFPVMMFGLPAGALAMYHTAKENKKKVAAGLLGAAALSAFFTGVTEPLEFAFMFLAPGLYVVHALLTGITVAVVAALPVRAGFNFSAGFVDWFLSFKAPMALNPIYLLGIGLIVAVIYYVVFRIVIVKFNLKTPGREDDDDETKVVLANDNFTEVARIVLEGIGGKENVTSIDNCITRLRLEIKDYTKVDEKKIKSAGVAGVIRPGKTSVQVIIGTQVQHVADEFKKLCK